MNRRNFLKVAGAFTAMAASVSDAKEQRAVQPLSSACRGQKVKFHLAMAGFTYYQFSIDETLKALEKYGVHYLCVKNFHLPFNATIPQIRNFRKKCESYGVTPYGVGPIYMSDQEDVRKYFDYAAILGVDVLVGVPGEYKQVNGKKKLVSSRKMCERCSELAAEYDMKFAIHNHGANPRTGNPDLYPTLPATWELIKDLDPRMGFCMDIAYAFADKNDPATCIRIYGKRIFDGHLRNIDPGDNGSAGVSAADGKIDYLPIFQAFADVGFDGHLGLELANSFPKHPEWIPDSLNYFRSLISKIK